MSFLFRTLFGTLRLPLVGLLALLMSSNNSNNNNRSTAPTASARTAAATTTAKKKVVVVGAGFAGLSVAYHLIKDNHHQQQQQQRQHRSSAGSRSAETDTSNTSIQWEVQILEARDRIGGRVHTCALAGGGASADGDDDGGDDDSVVRVELGGQWVHEASGRNPIVPLVRELGLEFAPQDPHRAKKSQRQRSNVVFDAATGTEIDAGAYQAASRLFRKAVDNFEPDQVSIRTSWQDLLDRQLEAYDHQQQRRRRRRSTTTTTTATESSDPQFAVALNYLRHRTECYEGGRLSELSAALSDLYVNKGGPDRLLRGGYRRLLEALAGTIGRDRIRLHCNVASIQYQPAPAGNPPPPPFSSVVRIGLAGSEAEQTEIDPASTTTPPTASSSSSPLSLTADYCVCTVPLGVLQQRDKIRFVPDLPDSHQHAIRSMGMGLLNKIVLQFPKSFWGDLGQFGVADARDPSLTKSFFDCTHRGPLEGEGTPILMLFLGGNAARRIDYYTDDDDDDENTKKKTAATGDVARGLTDEQAVEDAMATLRRIFGDGAVPDPVATKVTRWMADPFAHGGYSFAKVGCTSEAYDKVAEPIGNLLFAGEHTSKHAHSTVHGAWETGEREAHRLIGWVRGTAR